MVFGFHKLSLHSSGPSPVLSTGEPSAAAFSSASDSTQASHRTTARTNISKRVLSKLRSQFNSARPHVSAAQKDMIRTKHELRDQLLRGESPDTLDSQSRTPLMRLAAHNSTKNLKRFMNAGANVELPDAQGNTPLMIAARHDCAQSLDLLIKSGANIHARNAHGETALAQAVASGHADSVQILLAHGAQAEIRENGRQLQTLAFRSGSPQVLSALISQGLDVNARTPMGRACFHLPTERPTQDHVTPLMQFATIGNAHKGSDHAHAMVDTLLKAGADLNAQDQHGQTALIHALQGGHYGVALALIDAGADVTLRDAAGYDALSNPTWNAYRPYDRLSILTSGLTAQTVAPALKAAAAMQQANGPWA